MENIKPVRIQRSRQHKMVSPNGLPIVYVGRPSYWGNPYEVEPDTPCACGCCDTHKGTTPEEAVKSFKLWIRRGKPTVLEFDENTKKFVPRKVPTQKEIKETLKGKNLACWCPLKDKDGKIVPCHADILLEIANK